MDMLVLLFSPVTILPWAVVVLAVLWTRPGELEERHRSVVRNAVIALGGGALVILVICGALELALAEPGADRPLGAGWWFFSAVLTLPMIVAGTGLFVVVFVRDSTVTRAIASCALAMLIGVPLWLMLILGQLLVISWFV